MRKKLCTLFPLHCSTGYQVMANRDLVVDIPPTLSPPPLTPDCGQHQWHCLDHLLWLTDTNPTVISRSNRVPYLPPWELNIHGGPQSALSQLCSVSWTACECTSQRHPPPSPQFFLHLNSAYFLPELSLSQLAVWVLFRLLFVCFFIHLSVFIHCDYLSVIGEVAVLQNVRWRTRTNCSVN